MMKNPPKIVFMGTPDFAVPALNALVANGYDIRAVITQPDRPGGRGRKLRFSAVKEAALLHGLVILQPKKTSSPEFHEFIHNISPDLLVVVAFGQILKKQILDAPTWGSLNIHASLLPKYRGAAPIHWAILNNERETGLTAMKMEEGLDSGPILYQEKLVIRPDETTGHLHDRLAKMSGNFLIKTLRALVQNKLKETPQDEICVSYASKIDRSMSRIKWGRPAQEISALIRGLDPWPAAHMRINDQDLKVFSSRIIDETAEHDVPGRIAGLSEAGIDIDTGKGRVRIRELQAHGKKRLPAGDFLRGFPLKKNMIME